jgi:hypothetical protein
LGALLPWKFRKKNAIWNASYSNVRVKPKNLLCQPPFLEAPNEKQYALCSKLQHRLTNRLSLELLGSRWEILIMYMDLLFILSLSSS